MLNLKNVCLRCGKSIGNKEVRPWFNSIKTGNCHPVTYYSKFLEEDDTYLCGPVVTRAHRQ